MNVIESMSDENLEYILEALDESIFRNFCISDEPYCYRINTIEEYNN